MRADRWRQIAHSGKDEYQLDAGTSERVFLRNVRVMAEQGATLRDMALELSRKQDGDYAGTPLKPVQDKVEKALRELRMFSKVKPR